MNVKSERTLCRMRFSFCMLLAAILAACSYLGARAPERSTVSVPIFAQQISEGALQAVSLEETKTALRQKREQALQLVQSVIDDEQAQESTRNEALAAKMALANRMVSEAEAEALLSSMGFGDTAVVLGDAEVTVIVPWQAAADERSRTRIIDAVSTQTGLAPECVKIMLSKK